MQPVVIFLKNEGISITIKSKKGVKWLEKWDKYAII